MSLRKILIAVASVASLALAPAAASADAPPQLPRLTQQAAQHYSIVALQRRFKGQFYLGGSRITYDRRLSNTKVREKVAWFQGDFFFNGHATIWYSQIGQNMWWNYSYNITQVDDYCYSVEHHSLKSCSRTYVVK